MKSKTNFLLAAFVAAFFTFASCSSGTETKTEEKSEMKSDTMNRPLAAGEKRIYQCPMDLDQKSDSMGKCAKCGMDLEPVIVKDTLK